MQTANTVACDTIRILQWLRSWLAPACAPASLAGTPADHLTYSTTLKPCYRCSNEFTEARHVVHAPRTPSDSPSRNRSKHTGDKPRGPGPLARAYSYGLWLCMLCLPEHSTGSRMFRPRSGALCPSLARAPIPVRRNLLFARSSPHCAASVGGSTVCESDKQSPSRWSAAWR